MKYASLAATAAAILLLSGCASTVPQYTASNATAITGASATPTSEAGPSTPEIPEPIYGNTGAFLCPFTEDGTVAPWVEKGMSASVGGSLGGTLGGYAGQKALEQVPFVGGWLGGMAGKKAGREIAIAAAGGWDNIRETSDLSFTSVNDMATYVMAKHSTHPQFSKVLEATYGIYPEFRDAMVVVMRSR